MNEVKYRIKTIPNFFFIGFCIISTIGFAFIAYLAWPSSKGVHDEDYVINQVTSGVFMFFSLMSIYFISNPYLLIAPMIGIGVAWASILAMPYAILAGALPARKMGLYMGVFNFFITLPQIANGIIGGPVVKYVYGSQAIFSLVAAGAFFLVAAFCVRFVDDHDDSPNGIRR